MRAVWLEDQKLSYRDNLPLPVSTPGEALIQVRLAGICATDLELVRGYYPFSGIPGHEFVGEVVEASCNSSWVGKRVVGEINAACGDCETCRAGRSTHCERRTVLGILNRNGAFAEYLSLPVANLHEVPETVSDQAAVFTEPLAAALEILQQVHIHPTDHVVVIGAGRLGQLIAATLALTGCELKMVARHPRQGELLRERHIKVYTETEFPPHKADVVVEASGTAAGFKLARQLVRPRGTIVLKSTYKGDVRLNFSEIVVDELTLVGSRCGPFSPALDLLEKGEVNPLPLIEGCYPLMDGLLAFEHAARPGVLKILVDVG